MALQPQSPRLKLLLPDGTTIGGLVVRNATHCGYAPHRIGVSRHSVCFTVADNQHEPGQG